MPGSALEIEGATYLVMERRHRYGLKLNRYVLQRILLSVQRTDASEDRNCEDGGWAIGTVSCRYNAQSPLLRCAVNPEGPCDRCPSFLPIA